jgi:hypothetical protein
MGRAVGVLNLIQAAVFAGGAWWLQSRWGPVAGIAAACAVAQLTAAAALLGARNERIARAASALTLVGTALILGFFLHACAHLISRFGPDAQQTGKTVAGAAALALPWLCAFPLWQVLSGRSPDRKTAAGGAATLLALALPPLVAQTGTAPDQTWPGAGEALVPATEAAFGAWTGSSPVDIPSVAGPATVLLTPWTDGAAGASVRGDGPDLATAIQAAVAALPEADGGRNALVLDVALERWDDGIAPLAVGGGLSKGGGVSPASGWRPGGVTRTQITPLWRVPALKLRGAQPARFESAIATTDGTWRLGAAWTAPEGLTADTAREAALAGARMVMANQAPDGKFSYVVRGPTGARSDRGYNYPRHAGTAWFLARVAVRTGDPEVRAAADLALAWMLKRDNATPQGGSYVADPRRKDGQAWVGTTALAALAAETLDHPIASEWGTLLARSVDDAGQVRGELDRKTGVFAAQAQNPYGQGQTLLALASLVRGGQDDIRPALERASAFSDGPYAPLGAVKMVGLDEHWSCLAALATRDALNTAGGSSLCEAYLAGQPAPALETGFWPSAGPAGGGGEAIVAGAYLFPGGEWDKLAVEYGRLFLASLYRPSDAGFLPKPGRLIGGFRDRPWDLDVRIDSVQHIGCALLGIEAILADRVFPGSLP